MPSKAKAAAPYVNRPEISEVFADSVQGVIYNSSVARIELAVSRASAQDAADPRKKERVTAARLVLTTPAMVELFVQLKNVLDQLEKQGAVTKHLLPPHTVQ